MGPINVHMVQAVYTTKEIKSKRLHVRINECDGQLSLWCQHFL